MKPKRLSMYIPREIHTRLKLIAVMRNMTITKLVLRAVMELIKKEEK